MDASSSSMRELLKGSNRTLPSVKSLGLNAEENDEEEWDESGGEMMDEDEQLAALSRQTTRDQEDERSAFIIRNIEKYVKCYVEQKREDLLALREAIQGDKWIPANITDEQLTLFFFAMQFDVPRTVLLLRSNYKLRASQPHLFSSRSVFDPLIQEVWGVMRIVVFPKRPEPKRHILYLALRDFEPSHLKSSEVLKLFFMCADIYYILEGIPKNIILIINAEGTSYAYATRQNYHYLKIFIKYVQESMPYIMESIHIVNSSPVVRRIFQFVRPFLSKSIIKMIEFHDDCNLTNIVPPHCVPVDLGGQASGTSDEYQNAFRQKFEMAQEFFDIEEEQRTTHME